MMEGLEEGAVQRPDHDGQVALSTAISLKRIADAFDGNLPNGSGMGTIAYYLDMIASAANAGRS